MGQRDFGLPFETVSGNSRNGSPVTAAIILSALETCRSVPLPGYLRWCVAVQSEIIERMTLARLVQLHVSVSLGQHLAPSIMAELFFEKEF